MILFDKVTKDYPRGSRPALNEISLEIERMEHLGAIVAHLHDENIRIFDFAVNRNGTGPLVSFLCQFSAILPERRDHPELLAELSALEGVILIEEI